MEDIKAARNVNESFNEFLLAGHDPRPESLAREVRTRRRTFTLPSSRAFALQAGLFAALNESASTL